MYKNTLTPNEKNKIKTMRRLIDAVSEVFRNEGHTGLGVNKVARIAGVNKKLIYRYFNNFNGLLEAFVLENDYWMRFSEQLSLLTVPTDLNETKRLLSDMLKNQFLYFQAHREMQELILWELSGKSILMSSIHRTREIMGQQLLEMTDPYFENSPVNFRAIAALLVGGIYYIILHTRFNGNMFSDINVSTDEGQRDMVSAIDLVLDMVFANASGGKI